MLKGSDGRGQMKQVSFAIAVFIFVSTTGRCVNFTVSNNSDAGAGSLRQAITDANLAGGGTITFSGVSGTIALESSLPMLVTNTFILGPGVNELTVSAVWSLTLANELESMLTNALGSTTYIRGLRLTGKGAIVRNFGRLTLNECAVNDGSLGAIDNAGSMYLQNCVVANNRGNPSRKGAGIYNAGDLSMDDCTVSGNHAMSNEGGGIYNAGTMDLSRCLIYDNLTTFGSGSGIYNSGTARLNACTVARNDARDGSGGSIFNSSGTVILRHCSITNNTSITGGGIWNRGWVEAFGCVFSGNRATYSGGPTPGGAIYNDPKGTVLIENTTISRNSSLHLGGGIMNHGRLVAMNSTIASNAASGTGPVRGGGIWNAGTVHSKNSIFAGNTAAQGPDFYGTLFSDGFNLIQNTNDCAIAGVSTGNLTGVDPLLGSLQDNGGPTWTHALLSGSPAIENGSNYGAPSTDQRGVPRPQGLNVDIGAFEFQPAQPMFVAITVQSPTNAWLQSWSGPGASHTLETSTNLTQWLSVTNFNAHPNGLWEFNDTKLKDHPTRFYRVK
jgi:hypothetical protein